MKKKKKRRLCSLVACAKWIGDKITAQTGNQSKIAEVSDDDDSLSVRGGIEDNKTDDCQHSD